MKGLLNSSSTNNSNEENISLDDMSFEEKTKMLVIDDAEQWERFRKLLKIKGTSTNIAIKHQLVEFATERERIIKSKEQIKKIIIIK